MPAATNKSDLRAITVKEFAKLDSLLQNLPPPARLAPDPEADGTTPEDIVGHRAHWIALFLGWHRDGLAGKLVEIPAPGYKWNQLKAFNADLRRAQSGLTWDAACDMLRMSHGRLLGFIDDQDEAALYGGAMAGGRNAWTTGRWAEAAGASHYRSAAKYIRARAKAQE